MESSQETQEMRIENFLKQDILTTPKYHVDAAMVEEIMKMRNDSRGQPVRRTFLGSSESFFDAEKMIEKRKNQGRKFVKKKASCFGGALPNITSPSKASGSQKETYADEYNRNFNKKKNETDNSGFNKSHRMSSTIGTGNDSAIKGAKKDVQVKRNLSVGFGSGQELAAITSGGLDVIKDNP